MELITFFGGFALGLGLKFCFDWAVEKRASSLYWREKGRRGFEKKQEIEGRLQAALVEAAALYKAGTPPIEIAKHLLPKYPDVALKLGKQLAEKGFNFEELIGRKE